MSRVKYSKIVALSAIFLLLRIGIVFAVEDDFVAAKKISGKYFTVFYGSGLDILAPLEQLNVGSSDRILTGKTTETKFSPEQELVEMLDTLFIRVCDILDMRLYNFEGNIKICRDNTQLSKIYFNFFSRRLNDIHSFYIYELNTIYVSVQDFKIGIVGHEIAHAVISHYFVVLPSVKIQEVLSGYVEYQLRKYQNIKASP